MPIEFGNKQIDKIALEFGALPIELFHNKDGQSAYALENSNVCSLVIDSKCEADADYYRSVAWSSSLNHYLAFNSQKENFLLYGIWNSEYEELPYNSVINNLPLFGKYLQKSQSNGISAIDSCLKLFRAMRTQLQEVKNGDNSLSAFLYLLSEGEKLQTGSSNLIIPTDAVDIFNSLPQSHQDLLLQQINDLLHCNTNRMDLDLVLRHTSGQLFEEANLYANVNLELLLFPFDNLSYQYQSQGGSAIYTPNYVARTIVEESLRNIPHVLEQTEISVFDPACGSGIFVVELLRQLKHVKYQGKIKAILWDKAKSAIEISKFIMSFEKCEWGDRLDYKVVQQNSLTHEWPKSDFVFMNPPYKSWELMDSEERDEVKEILSEKLAKKPNLAAVFYYLAIKCVSNKGILGCLVPTSILYSESHRVIRELTKEYLTPSLMAKLGSYLFNHAMVDVSIIVASRRIVTQVLWTPNKPDLAPQALAELRRCNNDNRVSDIELGEVHIYSRMFKEYEKFNNGSWQPISIPSYRFVQTLENRVVSMQLSRIKDIFEIKQGARTGANKVFIICKREFENLPENERSYFRPSVDSSSLKYGVLHKENYLFFPSSNAFIDEDDLSVRMPVYYANYLLPNKCLLMKRADIVESKWWELTRPREWQRDQFPKLVSSEFGNSYNFAYDNEGDFVVERGHMWELKDGAHVDVQYAYLAILRSSLMNQLLECYAKQLAGGQWYALSKANVGMIPFPNFLRGQYFREMKALSLLGRDLALTGRCDEAKLEDITRTIFS